MATPVDPNQARRLAETQTGYAPDQHSPGPFAAGQLPPGPHSHDQQAGSAPTRRKRRRKSLGKRLFIAGLAVVVLVIALVAAAPFIVSIPQVRDYAVAQINSGIEGHVALDEIALSWFSPSRIRGLKITDPEKHEIVSVADATWSGSIVSLFRDPWTWGEIRLVGPRIVLKVSGADEDVSLVRTFRSRKPKKPERDDGDAKFRLPSPTARISIADAFIRVEREGSPPVEIKDLDADLAINSFNELSGKLDAALADGGRLTGDVSIKGAAPGGEFAPEQAVARIVLKSGEAIALKPWGAIFAPEMGLEGAATVAVDATVVEKKVSGDFSVDLAALRTRGGAAGETQPMNISLKGKAAVVSDRVTADATLTSDAAAATATIEYVPSDKPLDIDTQAIVSAALTGRALSLPDVSIRSDGRIDLGKLAQAIPALLASGEGRGIRSGLLEWTKLSLTGGMQPSATGGFALKDAVIRDGGRDIRVEPMTAVVDALLETGKGLAVRSAELKSSFATVTASGDAGALKAVISGNLAKLKQELGQFVDLGKLELGGDVNGRVEVARAGDERVNVTLALTGKQVAVRTESGRIELPQADVEQTGFVTLANQQATRYTAEKARVDLGGQLSATGAGWIDLAGGAFAADVDAPRVDMGFVAQQAAKFGVEGLSRLAGVVAAKGRVERANATSALLSTGQLTTGTLTADGQALFDAPATVTWERAEAAGADGLVRIAAAGLQSTMAQLSAKNVSINTAQAFDVQGEVDANADLKPLLATIARLTKSSVPSVAGRFSGKAVGKASGGRIALTGSGAVEQFAVGEGSSSFSDPRLQLEWDASADPKSQSLQISRFKTVSTPVTAEVSGTVERYAADCALNLKGRYQARWDDLVRMLHALAPSTAELVLIKGETASDFEIKGPLAAPQVTPAFRGVTSAAGVSWASASIEGINVGAAQLPFSLAEGRLTLPATVVPAGEGRVNLAAAVDFATGEPTLRVPSGIRVLDRIVVTKTFADAVLSRINPLFMFLVKVDGRATLGIREEFVVPLGESITRGGAGAARLDLSSLRMKPSGFFSELMQLGGIPDQEMYEIKASAVDLTIKEGRLRYDNFTLSFPEGFDLMFHGSVGFDDTLDLYVSIPVKPKLLERLGVRGPVLDYARLLSKARVDIPLTGTRKDPKLDFSRVDVKGLLAGVLKESPETAIEGLLGGLQKELSGRKDPPPPQKKEPARRSGERPRRRR